jgi:hypothetical protein
MERMTTQLGPAPTRPDLQASSSGSPPDAHRVFEYVQHIGVLRPVSEEDARWILAMLESHPDARVRWGMLMHGGMRVFSQGLKGELQKSEASQDTRDAVAVHLLRAIHEGSREERFYAGMAACSARLWASDPLFRDAIEVMRTYPDDEVRRSFDSCFEEIDRVEREKK